MVLTKDFIKTALPKALLSVLGNTEVDECFSDDEVSLSIDSRTVQAGEVFLALSGARSDAHLFLQEAIDRGARALVVHRQDVLASLTNIKNAILVIEVADTLQALFDLARSWRALLTIPIVGITGSVGKTTTKEMLRNILEKADVDAFVSAKNQNTDIGVSINMLRVQKKHKAAVFEMGIDGRGEMACLADLVRPTVAAITLVSQAHGKGLGPIHSIANEKRQIFRYFSSSHIGVINGDQELISDFCYDHPVARFGLKTKNQVQARKVATTFDADGQAKTTFTLKWYNHKRKITLPHGNAGYVINALAASTLAYLLEVPFEAVVKGIETYPGCEGRFERKPLKSGKGFVISDCYNANPESMKAALQAFNTIPSRKKKIVVLGDMIDLGDREDYWHRQIGRFLSRVLDIDMVILVGKRVEHVAKTAPVMLDVVMTQDWQEATAVLKKSLSESDESAVLIKASRGMGLDRIVKTLV